LVACGVIRVADSPFPERLGRIFDGVAAVVGQHAPDEMAIEQVFMHKNADSALKLGQARGAAICAALAAGLPVHEYAARQVKQAIVGRGAADKTQVRQMVKYLLRVTGDFDLDASDALGVAVCHAHHRQTLRRMAAARR
jgi:crossover junction endodeoxyribonuclease RuvC